jgi:hypothetical protein
MAQNMEIQCKLKRTFSGRHKQQPRHLEEALEDTLHDQIPALDPTKKYIIKCQFRPIQDTAIKNQSRITENQKDC